MRFENEGNRVSRIEYFLMFHSHARGAWISPRVDLIRHCREQSSGSHRFVPKRLSVESSMIPKRIYIRMEWTKSVFYVSFPFNTVRPCILKRRNERTNEWTNKRTFAYETRPIVKYIRNSPAVDITFRNASLPSTAIRK